MKMALSGRVITVPSLFFLQKRMERLLEQAGNTDFSRRSIYSRGAVQLERKGLDIAFLLEVEKRSSPSSSILLTSIVTKFVRKAYTRSSQQLALAALAILSLNILT